MVPLRSVLSVGLFSQTLLNPPNGAHKILLTNDDGWAVAQIRAEYNALNAAGYDVRRSKFLFLVHDVTKSSELYSNF